MTAAIYVARSPCAGDNPVVSKSMTATASILSTFPSHLAHGDMRT